MNLTKLEVGVGIETPEGILPIRHIIGIGRNYADHAKEQGLEPPQRPLVFFKSPASACVDGNPITIPPCCRDADTGGEQVDFEAELAVILAVPACDVPLARAQEHILGYCCANDVSARWWQKKGAGGQFCRGKSFDSFCPLGPRVVPAAELDPSDLAIECRVNGRVMQCARTNEVMFHVEHLIAELSRGTTLPAGTAILTGTPAGVGMARDPQVWLRAGDTVEVEIEKIGVLKNTVVASE